MSSKYPAFSIRQWQESEMPKKPTTTFRTWVFSTDGKVTRDFQRLPPDQKGQEEGVAKEFKRLGGAAWPTDHTFKMLGQDDHDFEILTPDGDPYATVQCTELVLRDYAKKLSQEEYDAVKFSSTVVQRNEDTREQENWGIDGNKQVLSVTNLIDKKMRKHYSRPAQGEFWLLIWSVLEIGITPNNMGGEYSLTPAIQVATDYLANAGPDPFDKVFFFNMITHPTQVWPPF